MAGNLPSFGYYFGGGPLPPTYVHESFTQKNLILF